METKEPFLLLVGMQSGSVPIGNRMGSVQMLLKNYQELYPRKLSDECKTQIENDTRTPASFIALFTIILM